MRLGFEPQGLDWNYAVGIKASRQEKAREESNDGGKIVIEVSKNVICISLFLNDCSIIISLTWETVNQVKLKLRIKIFLIVKSIKNTLCAC